MEIKEKEHKENKCLGDIKEKHKSKFDENDKNYLGLVFEFKEEIEILNLTQAI